MSATCENSCKVFWNSFVKSKKITLMRITNLVLESINLQQNACVFAGSV